MPLSPKQQFNRTLDNFTVKHDFNNRYQNQLNSPISPIHKTQESDRKRNMTVIDKFNNIKNNARQNVQASLDHINRKEFNDNYDMFRKSVN